MTKWVKREDIVINLDKITSIQLLEIDMIDTKRKEINYFYISFQEGTEAESGNDVCFCYEDDEKRRQLDFDKIVAFLNNDEEFLDLDKDD